MLSNKYIDPSCDADVVKTSDFRETIERTLSAIESRSPEEKAAALERRKALSALGGVAELDAVEGDYMTLNIYRDNPVLDFMEMRNLPLGSVPFYRTRYNTPIQFTKGSVNAMGNSVYWATNDAGTQVGTFTVTSDEITIPNLNAIYDMVRLEQRLEGLKRLSRDMNVAITNVGLNTVLANSTSVSVVTDDPAVSLTGYFTDASGSSYFNGKNVYVLDPGVVAAGVPTTNCFDLSATEQGLTKLVFQTINDYRIQLGLNVRKIYVPNAPGSSGKTVWRGLQDSAAIVALASSNGNQDSRKVITPSQAEKFKDQDFSANVTENWFGQSFSIERQNWMPANYLLVFFEQPCAILWDRLDLATGEDRAGTLEVPVNGYMSRRSEARQIGTARPAYCLKYFMVIKTS